MYALHAFTSLCASLLAAPSVTTQILLLGILVTVLYVYMFWPLVFQSFLSDLHLNLLMQVSMAGDMATWLVTHSQMHPAFSDSPVMYDMNMGGYEDPTTRNTAGRFEALILELQVYRLAVFPNVTTLLARN